MSRKDLVVELSDINTIKLGEKDRHSISIKVGERNLATFHGEDKDFLIANGRDLAGLVAFAVHYGVDDQIEILLERGTVLHDMFSVGSVACSCIMSAADGHENGLIFPQDGSEVMGTLVKGESLLTDPEAKVQCLQPEEVVKAARMVLEDFNATEDKESFSLTESANKALTAINAKYEEGAVPLDVEKVDLFNAFLDKARSAYDKAIEINKITEEMFDVVHPIGSEGIADVDTSDIDAAVDLYSEHLFGHKYFGHMNKNTALKPL